MTGWQIQNNLNDRVTSQMIESKGTVEVDLSFNGLGDDEAKELARVIKQSKTIKRLILANNHIHQDGAKAIAEGVRSLPCVHVASKSSCACSLYSLLLALPARLDGIVPGAALTPETGKDDPPLEVLVLRNNSIGDEGATALAQVLTCNKTLKKVDLYWNNIGNTGLIALVDVLRPNLPKDYVLVPCFLDCLGPCVCLFLCRAGQT